MLEHVLIVERTLGKELPKGVEIHHVDGNGRNNTRTNLVVCPDHAYHALLHKRTEALEVTGNPNWRKCCFCKQWDAPENLAFWKVGSRAGQVVTHRDCANEQTRKFRARHPEWGQKLNDKRRKMYAEDSAYRKLCNERNRAAYRVKQNG